MKHSERIKYLRETFGLTQKELAKKLNELSKKSGYSVKIFPQTISYWENGREPNFESLVLLKEYFNVSIEYLIGISDEGGIEKYLTEKTILIENIGKNSLLERIEKLPMEKRSLLYEMAIDFYDFHHFGMKSSTVESDMYNFVLIAEITCLAKDMFEAILWNQIKMLEEDYEDMRKNDPERMIVFYNRALCDFEIEIKLTLNRLFEFSIEMLSYFSDDKERNQEYEYKRLLNEIDRYVDIKQIKTSSFMLDEFKDRHKQ